MNSQNMKLGFSTGVLYKTHRTKEALEIMRDLGYDTVELGFVKLSRIEEGWLDEITYDVLKGFAYISLHAPELNYGKNNDTRLIFERIERINKIRNLDTVVFHPDLVEDFNVFKNVNFNVAFENMDNTKESYRQPVDFDEIFSENEKYKLALDVNHIYTNDSSMKLASIFYEKFGDRISHLHLSGHIDSHNPFFETEQINILRAIQDFNAPMIIESVLSADNLEKERNYIMRVISDLKKDGTKFGTR
jgi:sugar phosphate isomerase/epimerase